MGFHSCGSVGGIKRPFYLVCAVRDVTPFHFIHISKPNFWLSWWYNMWNILHTISPLDGVHFIPIYHVSINYQDSALTYWVKGVQSKMAACLKSWYLITMVAILEESMGVGAGKFLGLQRIFCLNFSKFDWKTFMRWTSPIFCSCWYIIFSSNKLP